MDSVYNSDINVNTYNEYCIPLNKNEFQSYFLRLIAMTWLLPPMVGFSFLLYIEVFSFSQLIDMLSSPLKPIFLIGGFLFAMFYFHRFAQPLINYLASTDEAFRPQAVRILKRFPFHYWLVFLSYMTLAPAAAIVSLEIATDYVARPVDWFRIHLVALIVSIIVGLPIFISIYDLFGRAFSRIQLHHPIITIKTRVFLIGALIPLLIDTMLVQYYWTRTGFFNTETFFIWLLLEGLAIAGTLLFVRSFNQSLSPLRGLIDSSMDTLGNKIQSASTDELGIFSTQLSKLLDEQQLHKERLAFSNELLKASHSHESLARLLQTIVDRTCQTLGDDICFLSLCDDHREKLICVARSNADYKPDGHFKISLDETSLATEVFHSGKTQIIEDAFNNPRIHQQLRETFSIFSSAAVPLMAGEKIMGVLQTSSIDSPHCYSQHEIKILQAFAQEAAVIQTFFEDMKHRRKAETAITQIMRGVSTTTGEDFFNAITLHMADILQSDSCGIVSIIPDSEDTVTTLAHFYNGEIISNTPYSLSGTPCETIIGQQVRTYVSNIQDIFPEDTQLKENGIESYVGIPLFNSQSQPQGLLFAMFRNEIKDIEFNESVMQIFAARTAAEIERTQIEKRINRMAYYDNLTQLPNRAYLMDRLQHDIAYARRHHTRLAVLMMDLDHFKKINDSLGHPVGDGLLIEVSQRLQKCVRKEDTVARLGGDEFIIVQANFDTRKDAITHVSRITKNLHKTLKNHYSIAEHTLMITTSCGIAIYPDDGESAEQLIKHADTALYKAKARGRDNYQFFSSEMNDAAMQRLQMESDIHHGIKNNEFNVAYQPKVNIADNKIIGAEALLRWHHPQHGMISPEQFISVADETGQIIQLGEYILQQACDLTTKLCNSRYCNELNTLSVNVSPRQFQQHNFITKFQQILEKYTSCANCIELEITENILITDTSKVSEKLHALKAMGIKISIDDFGTGYASLRYLQQLPIDMIKIDRSFITHITDNTNDQAIVKTIMSMAKNLNIEVIAEGVETAEQLEQLKQLGCPLYQGYYFSKPVSKEKLAEMIQQQRKSI